LSIMTVHGVVGTEVDVVALVRLLSLFLAGQNGGE